MFGLLRSQPEAFHRSIHIMNSNKSRHRGRGQRNGGQRRNQRDAREPRSHNSSEAPKKLTFWQKLISFFTGGTSKTPIERMGPRPVQRVAVTSPKLYVGNLSFRALDSDLFDLFKGVGDVQYAEIVFDRQTDESKGFGFVTMQTVDDAKRAAERLHDKDFMGRRLVVSGSKSDSRRDF